MANINKIENEKYTRHEKVGRLISIEEAAKMCGISRSTLYELMNSGKTPLPIKLGKRVLFDIVELEDWIANKCPPRSKWAIMRNAT